MRADGGWYDIFTQGTIDVFVGYQLREAPGRAEILVALARRLRAKPLAMKDAQPQQFAAIARPNTAPLPGSIIVLGDMVASVGNAWEADT